MDVLEAIPLRISPLLIHFLFTVSMSVLAFYSYIHSLMLFMIFLGVVHTHPKLRLPDAYKAHCITLNLMAPIILSQRQDWLPWTWIVCSVLPGVTIILARSRVYATLSGLLQMFYFYTFYKQTLIQNLEKTLSINMIQLCLLIGTIKIIIDASIVIILDSQAKSLTAQTEQLKAQEKLRLKARTLTLSHELRNPINSMVGHVQLALLEKLPAHLKDYLQTAKFCGDLLVHTLNNILDREKIEVDNLDINSSSIKIYESVEKSWEFLSEFIKTKKLYGHLKIQKRVPKIIHVDNSRLSQILFNLVKNAVDYTERGVVTVNIDWISDLKEVNNSGCFPSDPFHPDDEGSFEKDNRITWMNKDTSEDSESSGSSILDLKVKSFGEEHYHHQNPLDYMHKIHSSPDIMRHAKNSTNFQEGCGVLKIEISDTGCGISPEALETIFQKPEEHLQAESLKPLTKGYDLYVTRELCKKMGGEIKCYSRAGTGSLFVICLPLSCVYETQVHHKTEKRHTISEAIKESSHSLKALIVDDLDWNLTVLESLLQKMGVKEIVRASNGLEATEKFHKAMKQGAPFNLVMMDLEMPIMEGKTASKRIRQIEKEFEMDPCLLMIVSGNCVQEEILECLNQEKDIRADHFVKKPAKMEDIKNALNLYKKKL